MNLDCNVNVNKFFKSVYMHMVILPLFPWKCVVNTWKNFNFPSTIFVCQGRIVFVINENNEGEYNRFK